MIAWVLFYTIEAAIMVVNKWNWLVNMVDKWLKLQLACLMFISVELAICGINICTWFNNTTLGRRCMHGAVTSFELMDKGLSSTIIFIVFNVSLVVGNPTPTTKTTCSKRGSNRSYNMRSVPWKHRIMRASSLLAFASNTIGATTMRKRRPKGTIHGMHAFITRSTGQSTKHVRFDTDSFRIKVDNCCISNSIGDFIGPVQPVNNKEV
jgi:hypothetical protein